MHIDDLDTPAVLIDLDRVEANLRRWQAYCDEHGIANRPHIKTHKLVEMAHRQIELGAVGIACQKLGEAETMAEGGIRDILIPYNVVGAAKMPRAVALAERIDLTLSCDSIDVARPLAEAFAAAKRRVRLVVECDTGAKRCGVTTPEAARDLARAVDALEGAEFAGLMVYPAPQTNAVTNGFLGEAKSLLDQAGLPAELVSNGGTPAMWTAHEVTHATEHRVGTYIYYDRMQMAAGAARLEDCAITVLTTVVSRQSDRGALDAGSKALSSDLGGQETHGLILDYPEIRIAKLSEEHGHLDLSPSAARPRVGERVRVVPNHACVVSNLVDEVVGVRGDRVERRFKVAARGRLQ